MILTEKCMQDFQEWVLECYPNEAVAYVVGDDLVTITNVSPTPLVTFEVSAEDQFRARQLGDIQALLHSHPYDVNDSGAFSYPPEWPSTTDMKMWMNDNIPWGIVATDGEGLTQMVWMDDANPEPLEGRLFIHGINDCYSVVRDWFRQEKGITLMNFARGMDWWLGDEDLYEQNFRAAGFVEITEQEATIGDVVLMSLNGDKITHAAVIAGPNEILHHLMNRTGSRLSGYDSWSKWHRQVIKYVRYAGVTE